MIVDEEEISLPICSQCTLSLLPENIWCFQVVEKGCIGEEWVNITESFGKMSHVKGYPVYHAFWTVIWECLLSEGEPYNPKDKYVAWVKK